MGIPHRIMRSRLFPCYLNVNIFAVILIPVWLH
ncbi:hypothetical protein vBEcoMWL3_gp106 [Escherichia phage vB_EcoM_WL-3]|nr:hypothetical protein vBEcoMWL3_gp106 [Escherichia phage vB_EcoM_WL-3]